jgi:hypothetical protein
MRRLSRAIARPGYRAAKALRLGKTEVDLLIIEGVEGEH